jgi:hypothetical protein
MNGFAAFAAFVYAVAVSQSGLAVYCAARALADLKSGRRLWALAGFVAATVAALLGGDHLENDLNARKKVRDGSNSAIA